MEENIDKTMDQTENTSISPSEDGITVKKGMCPLRPLHQNLSDFLGEKEDLYLTFPSPIPNT